MSAPSFGGERPSHPAGAVPLDVCIPQGGKRPAEPSAGNARDVCVPPGGERPTPCPSRAEWDVCRRTRWPDLEIGDIGSRQYGLITRAQLAGLGLPRSAIDHSIARGRLRPIHRGVYAVGHLAMPNLAVEMAAVLAVGDGAVLSHRSAGALWGLMADPDPRREVHVTLLARDAGRRRAGIRVHRTASLDQRDVATLHGIPTTTPARTLLDTAPSLTGRELERGFDDALTRRLFTRHEVVALLERNPGRTGADRLAELARAELRTSTLTRSETEERLLKLIRRGGLPAPRLNARVGRFIVDFLWSGPQLIVEVDGYQFHSTRRAFEHDRTRDLELGASGFQLMRFSWRQIVDQPELVLTRLTQRLTELSAQSGRSSRFVS